jgi:hypothetical protein
LECWVIIGHSKRIPHWYPPWSHIYRRIWLQIPGGVKWSVRICVITFTDDWFVFSHQCTIPVSCLRHLVLLLLFLSNVLWFFLFCIYHYVYAVDSLRRTTNFSTREAYISLLPYHQNTRCSPQRSIMLA